MKYLRVSLYIGAVLFFIVCYARYVVVGGSWKGSCEFMVQNAVCTLMRPGALVTHSLVDGRFAQHITGLVWFHVRAPEEFSCVQATITYQSDQPFEFALQQGPSLTDFQYQRVPATQHTWEIFSITYQSSELRYNTHDARYQASIRTQTPVILDRFEIRGTHNCAL